MHDRFPKPRGPGTPALGAAADPGGRHPPGRDYVYRALAARGGPAAAFLTPKSTRPMNGRPAWQPRAGHQLHL